MKLDAPSLITGFLSLGAAALVIAVGVQAYRTTQRKINDAQAQLVRRGYARQTMRREHGGPVTQLWARMAEPCPIYLRVLNNDGMSVALGDLFGVADLKVGDARFDGNFVVRSNFPDAARAVLDQDMRRRLMRLRGVDFCTGAISNLLGPDYFPQQTDDRDLRTLWRLRIEGDVPEAECKPLLALARELVERLQAQAARGGFVSEDYRVAPREAA